MAKVDRRISNMVTHRKRWLEKLLQMREYNIKSESKRRWFLFVYYCTVSVNCDERLSRELLDNINASMREPMTDKQLEQIIRDVKRQGGSNFTDETLIGDFYITNEEILELGIGAKKREQEERKKRKTDRKRFNEGRNRSAL